MSTQPPRLPYSRHKFSKNPTLNWVHAAFYHLSDAEAMIGEAQIEDERGDYYADLQDLEVVVTMALDEVQAFLAEQGEAP